MTEQQRTGKMRAGVYRLNVSAKSHSRMLSSLADRVEADISDRRFEAGGRRYQLNRVDQRQDFTIVEFLDLRDSNLPLAVREDGETSVDYVDSNEYLGEESLVCLSNKSNALLLQRARYAPRSPTASALLATAAGDDSPDAFAMSVVVTPNAVEDLSELKRGSKFEVAGWIHPAAAEQIFGQASTLQVADCPGDSPVRVQVSVSVGNSTRSSVAPGLLKGMISKFVGFKESDMRGIEARANGWNEYGERVKMDFVEGIADTEATFKYDRSFRNVPYSVRAASIVEIWKRMADDMEDRYPFS